MTETFGDALDTLDHLADVLTKGGVTSIVGVAWTAEGGASITIDGDDVFEAAMYVMGLRVSSLYGDVNNPTRLALGVLPSGRKYALHGRKA